MNYCKKDMDLDRVSPCSLRPISGKLVHFPMCTFSQLLCVLLLGKVPDGLQKRFGDKSFAENAALCGSSPLPDCLLHHLQQHLLKLWFPQILVHCPRRRHWLSTKEKV
ncbi:hypothetical protein Sjap_003237 [Stephania japonica]|uniref:Uncharacterized protein n=1 Tax=Stephania japonica TaxID=461633 RepID=A0AAP0KNC7_9MAGN